MGLTTVQRYCAACDLIIDYGLILYFHGSRQVAMATNFRV